MENQNEVTAAPEGALADRKAATRTGTELTEPKVNVYLTDDSLEGDDDTGATEKSYPTEPDAEGWYYADGGEEHMEIETQVDEETEDTLKRVRLTKGRVCVLRELTHKEGKKAAMIAGMNQKSATNRQAQERAVLAYVAIGGVFTSKDGQVLKYVMEDLEEFKAKDVNRLTVACTSLNF